jgi:S-adenosylmethionine:tRNA ribosyltransferase-isomerase
MHLSDLQYDLPPELIAQHPVVPRDASRLLVLHRTTGRIEHRAFRDLWDYLARGDALVLNNTRVIPARFFCRRATGRHIEGLFLHQEAAGWRVMLKSSRRVKVGELLVCDGSDVRLAVARRLERGEWLVRPEPEVQFLDWLAQVGHTPLPPYIRRGRPEAVDAARYQTVYAERPGAVAAPTAGLHFTPEMLEQLAARGVQRVNVTLHVGAGTFVPIEVEDLAEHRMHTEWYEVSADARATLGRVRTGGGRVVAVGTTAARVLESLPPLPCWDGVGGGTLPLAAWTDIFIYPPYNFRHVDRLVTNFHLPGSTLLALVMAFASPELIGAAYRAAIDRRYRFYSYGDAMLIL